MTTMHRHAARFGVFAVPQANPIRDATQAAAAALATLSRALQDRADMLENLDAAAAENLRRRSEAAALDAAALHRSLPEIP
jgi:hypothetical protein